MKLPGMPLELPPAGEPASDPEHGTGDASTPLPNRREMLDSATGRTVTLIEQTIIVILFSGLVFGVILVLRPVATAILFGAIFAIATWPVRACLIRSGLKPGYTAMLMLLAALVLAGLPMLVAAPRLAVRLADGAQQLEAALLTLPSLPPDWAAQLPLVGDRLARGWQRVTNAGGDVETVLAPYADWIRQSVLAVAKAMAESVLQFVLALVVAAMFWTNGDAINDIMRDVARRLGGETAAEALEAAGRSLRSVAYGVVGTAIIQGILMGVGAAIAGLPAPGLLGFVVLLLAISQIGSPLIVLVWGGGAWWLFRQGAEGWGIFELLWGLLLVQASDNLLRPWLISQGMAMPLTLVILGVFGGFLSLGFLGLFIGPALLAVAFTLLQAWRARAAPSGA